MIVRTVFLILVGAFFVIVQSVFLADILPLGLVPDIALLFILVSSWRNGPMSGIVCGFCIGLTSDALGLAPLGMHAFLYTLIGYLFGRLRGNIGPGGIIPPFIAAAIATAIKYSCAYLLGWILQMDSGTERFISMKTLYEMGLNAVIAPLFFQICFLFARIIKGPHKGFH